jgi:hypothetical protein
MTAKKTPRTRSAVGKHSRNKGKRFEREISRAYRESLTDTDIDVHRALQSERARESDVIVPGLWIECKAGRLESLRPLLKKADKQAIRDSKAHGGGLIPVVIYKYDRHDPRVRIKLKHLVRIIGEFQYPLLSEAMASCARGRAAPNDSKLVKATGKNLKTAACVLVELPFDSFLNLSLSFVRNTWDNLKWQKAGKAARRHLGKSGVRK